MRNDVSVKALIAALCLLCVASPSRAVYIVRLQDLNTPPIPPNPVRVVGHVVEAFPVRIRQGATTITVNGPAAEPGQILDLTGDWDGQAFTPTSRTVVRRTYPTVLALGDSITYSPYTALPPYAAFPGGYGMNASAEDKDYVHLVLARMRQADPANATASYSSHGAHQAGGQIADVLALLDTYRGYHADLITLQIGENDSSLTSEQFRASYAALLDGLLNNSPRPRLFCWGLWSPGASYAPPSRAYAFEGVMAAECVLRGIPFRSLKEVALDPAARDPGDGGINWHPNDAGMQGYADLFWDALGPELQWSANPLSKKSHLFF